MEDSILQCEKCGQIFAYEGPCTHAHKKFVIIPIDDDVRKLLHQNKFAEAKAHIVLKRIENGS